MRSMRLPSLSITIAVYLPYVCRYFGLHRATIYSWILDMMHALEFLHNRDPVIMHRDLKAGTKIPQIMSIQLYCPSTVMESLCMCKTLNLNPTNQAGNLILNRQLTTLKLADFGMSKMVKRADMSGKIHTGYTGTERYMAPEVLTQTVGHYTESADIYSAGLIMCYIATGLRPKAPNLENVKAGIVTLPDASRAKWPELAEIMNKCWVMEPSKRISASTAVAMLKQLPDAATLVHIDPAPSSCCVVSSFCCLY
jgi:serine/threonine protein kinase